MAKLGSFFRRLFSPNPSDNPNPSLSLSLTPETRPNVLIIPPPPQPPPSPSPPTIVSTSKLASMITRSCTTSPRMVTKQTTLNADSGNETIKSNYLSSDINKGNLRRLSAPLIIHTSSQHPLSQYPSTIVNESTEEALLSSLHRTSLSSPTAASAHLNHNIHILATIGSGSSGSLLSRPDNRSASFNLSTSPSSLSNNLVNNISSTSGR